MGRLGWNVTVMACATRGARIPAVSVNEKASEGRDDDEDEGGGSACSWNSIGVSLSFCNAKKETTTVKGKHATQVSIL